MKKHILKLVNNERTNVHIASKKGEYDDCSSNAYDRCPSKSTDLAFCGTYAFDICTKEDYSACQQGAEDVCSVDRDAPCFGPDAEDNY